MSLFARLLSSLVLSVLLASCGGGGGSGDDTDQPAALSVGGVVSGLGTSPVVLQNNGGNDHTVSANGPFEFSMPLQMGSTYNVTILIQPSDRVCTVTAGGSGIVASASASSVAVACQAPLAPKVYYTISGTISGLGDLPVCDGSYPCHRTVALQNNFRDRTEFGDGPFKFRIPVEGGAPYEVTVSRQPYDGGAPPRTGKQCVVAEGSGIATADITNVAVTCQDLAAPVSTVEGVVSGLLAAPLVLQLNGVEKVQVGPAVDGSGIFGFPTGLPLGSPYDITVLSQPSDGRTCTVTEKASGIVPAEGVRQAQVVCTGPAPALAPNQFEVVSDGLRLTTSIKLCLVGSTICQTIDRVVVDSGSTGLRIFTPVTIPLPQLAPDHSYSKGIAVGNGGLYECYRYAQHSNFGPVHQADVILGETRAVEVAVQLRGVPQTGSINCGASTPESFGYNGVLGIDGVSDCGQFCENTDQNTFYFVCPAGSCVGTRVSAAAQVRNPFYALWEPWSAMLGYGWNLELPLPNLSASSIKGVLTMGFGTLDNTKIPDTVTKLYTPRSANVNDMLLPVNVFDSGSPFTSFPSQALESAPPVCGIYFCPVMPTPVAFSLTDDHGNRKDFILTFVSPSTSAPVGQFAGPSSSSSVNFGLPFFYGRKIFWWEGVGVEPAFIAF